MTSELSMDQAKWNSWQKTSFRFFFIYFLLHIAPWTWMDGIIPGADYLTGYVRQGIEWTVKGLNKGLFHFPVSDVVNNGSGDTSYNWEEVLTFLLLAFSGMLLWSLADRKRAHYEKAAYWLRTFMRYFIIMMCMNYGIAKLFVSQMPFPNNSQLATPLGDFLPMRLSWLFIGYSAPYEMFTGAMELLAGILLFNRRTITLGLFMATAVFVNVVVLNLSYDIPVKLFSMHLLIYCLYLLSFDAKRLYQLLLLNKAVAANGIHDMRFPRRWQRISRLALKGAFLVVFVWLPYSQTRGYAALQQNQVPSKPFTAGLYDVAVFALNRDTLPGLISDTLRWRDIAFEHNGYGSVGSTDTSFRQRYRRGYFNFTVDTIKQTLGLKTKGDSNFLYAFHYELPDSSTIRLKGTHNKDSVLIVLTRSKRHFQLAERQFHWISEANR